jgi:Zn-dependent M28 family amino/carboxypeptidase
MALKIIAATGVLVFVFLLLTILVLRRYQPPPPEKLLAQVEEPRSSFDGNRAYADLEAIVSLGPRPPGSEAAEACRNYIVRELAQAGLEVKKQPFTAQTPRGPVEMVNIRGVVKGSEPGVILLGNHYDTKVFDEFEFVGALDGGSSTAWMLEMARTLGPRRDGKTVWLTFFDGEEAVETWTETDSLYGSRAFVDWLQKEGRLEEIDVMINLDMIGDQYLSIMNDPGAPRWLNRLIRLKAESLGYGQHFIPNIKPILDDHMPFRKAGVPAINLIDFMLGPTPKDHKRIWHTEKDTLDKASADSLQVVGDLVYAVLPDLDLRLNLRAE